MDETILNRFRELAYEKAGIALGTDKKAMIASRVAKRMRVLNIHDHEAYLRHMLEDQTGDEIVQLLDVISTNVTHFFRGPDHFEFVERVVRDWLRRGRRRLRIWSAGCSTGEEAYSLAMSAIDAAGGFMPDIRILATDLSTRALDTAQAGTYDEAKMHPVEPSRQRRYFLRRRVQGGTVYEVRDFVKNLIVFKRLNLAKPPFPMSGPLDIVFCRNVMIYFDDAGRRRLVAAFEPLLRSGGYLMVGHAEGLAGLTSAFVKEAASIYRKP
ncbi:MAG: chemotaxis protein CheR [Kiritimatiellae bacterium]|nr:chemotaxis protein CheR [Kiritimatiellia bacterium]